MMQRLANSLIRFVKSEDGPTAVEYAVMLALVIIVCIASVTTIGTNVNSTYQTVGKQVGKSGS
jgi:pilus assembly protein Flp/PilA